MSLFRVTLTGVDRHTSIERLVELSRRYPFVEWGFLYSEQRAGQDPRYPTSATIRAHTLRLREHDVPTALHLCGRIAGRWGPGTPGFQAAASAGRIQLNISPEARSDELVDDITTMLNIDRRAIILQENDANIGFIDKLISGIGGAASMAGELHLLVDSSGGRGRLPDTWPARRHNVVTGYAGGLGPDNLARELPRIAQVAGHHAFWVDMESALRDPQDRFDLDRCEAVLEVAQAFLSREVEPEYNMG